MTEQIKLESLLDIIHENTRKCRILHYHSVYTCGNCWEKEECPQAKVIDAYDQIRQRLRRADEAEKEDAIKEGVSDFVEKQLKEREVTE